MPSSTTQRRVGLSFSLGAKQGFAGTGARAAGPVQRVLIAADCSGRQARGLVGSIRERAVRQVDVDNFSTLCERWGAQVSSSLGSRERAPVLIELRNIEDLHPDQLLRGVAVLAEALRLRELLPHDPDAEAKLKELLARELAWSPGGPKSRAAAALPAQPAQPATEPVESSGDTLSRLLGGALQSRTGSEHVIAPSIPARVPGGVDVQRLIRSLVGATGSGPASPNMEGLVASTNKALQDALRAILQEPGFRALEATWRGIDDVLRHCPDEEQVQYSILDASLAELAAEPGGLAQVLAGGDFSLLLVDHCFRPAAEELQALAEVLQACASEQVALVTGAHARLAGCSGFSEHVAGEAWQLELSEPARAAWNEVARLRSAGARLALVLPRFLLRQPYGKSGEPLEQLPFEELVNLGEHDAFPWGNGAYLVLRVLAHLHVSETDPLFPDGSLDIRELPVVHLEGEEGIRLKPTAETWLSDRALGQLKAAGFSVLQALRDSDRIRVHVLGLD
jgi:type VI secretion system protein ImpC